MRGALFKHDPDGQSVRTSRGQPQVNCEYVIASSDDEIYFLSANGRQSMRADQDHHSWFSVLLFRSLIISKLIISPKSVCLMNCLNPNKTRIRMTICLRGPIERSQQTRAPARKLWRIHVCRKCSACWTTKPGLRKSLARWVSWMINFVERSALNMAWLWSLEWI